MTRHLDHDEIARLLDGYPHEDTSSYEDSNVLHRITTWIALGLAVFVTVFFVAQFAFHSSPRGAGSAQEAPVTIR